MPLKKSELIERLQCLGVRIQNNRVLKSDIKKAISESAESDDSEYKGYSIHYNPSGYYYEIQKKKGDPEGASWRALSPSLTKEKLRDAIDAWDYIWGDLDKIRDLVEKSGFQPDLQSGGDALTGTFYAKESGDASGSHAHGLYEEASKKIQKAVKSTVFSSIETDYEVGEDGVYLYLRFLPKKQMEGFKYLR